MKSEAQQPNRGTPAENLAGDGGRDVGGTDAGFPDENPNHPREYHGRRTMLVALMVVGAVAAALWLGLRGGGSARIEGDLGVVELPAYLNTEGLRVVVAIDALAPDFELETLSGERFRLSDMRGHPVVVNLWASWCGPCRREVPALIRLQQRYRDQGLIILGVNIEESRSAAGGFAEEFGINYTVPMDFSGVVTRQYLRQGPPNTIFVNPQGVVETIFVGQAPDNDFERTVAAMVEALAAPVGPGILPGPKALPTELALELPVGSAKGELAPDLILRNAGLPDAAGALWRLSTQQGLPVLLAFLPPNCVNCDGPLDTIIAAGAALGPLGVSVAVIVPDAAAVDAATLDATTVRLEWRTDVAQLFDAATSLRFVLIDSDGIIHAATASAAEIVTALGSLPSILATAAADAATQP